MTRIENCGSELFNGAVMNQVSDSLRIEHYGSNGLPEVLAAALMNGIKRTPTPGHSVSRVDRATSVKLKATGCCPHRVVSRTGAHCVPGISSPSRERGLGLKATAMNLQVRPQDEANFVVSLAHDYKDRTDCQAEWPAFCTRPSSQGAPSQLVCLVSPRWNVTLRGESLVSGLAALCKTSWIVDRVSVESDNEVPCLETR